MSKKNKTVPTIRSSAAEYLSFVAASGEGGVEAVYADEDVWLSQKMMGTLYDVETHTINYHLKKIFSDSELEEDAVIRNFRITAKDGKHYNTKHYNLSAIIAVGYKVNSERAVQFRKWATGIIKEYTIKAYVMDDERLKNDGTILGKKYFEEQLERIRDIRLSERKFFSFPRSCVRVHTAVTFIAWYGLPRRSVGTRKDGESVAMKVLCYVVRSYVLHRHSARSRRIQMYAEVKI